MGMAKKKLPDCSFIDVHAHILPGIDDGAKTIFDSRLLVAQLRSEGAKAIICTPHYIPNTDSVSPKEANESLLFDLKQTEQARTKLYLGNELYIDVDLDVFLKKKLISPLAGSKYLLVELPMSGKFDDYEDILNYLNRSYKVILAHPERYTSFQKDFSKIERLVEYGILLQCNYGTLMGQYGKEAEKTLKKILKNHYAFCFGSDIHHLREDGYYKRAIEKLYKVVRNEQYFRDIIYNNPSKIILKKYK